MIVQDISYIQIEETNSYVNGIASSKQTLHVNLDEKVDKDSSLVIYDGKNIDLTKDEITIDVEREGITQLVYILKDLDGYRLEEGEKTILLDTQSPVIRFSCPNTFYFDKAATIHVSILESNPSLVEAYLDDDLLEISEFEFDVDITSSNRKLKVICEDVAGHKTVQEVDLIPIMYPKLDIEKPVLYWYKNHYDFNISTKTDQNFDLDVYLDGEYYYSLPLENLEKVSLELLKNGTYTFQIKNRLHPEFIQNVDTKIIFSDIEPIVKIKPSQVLSKDSISLDILHNVSFIDHGYYEVEWNGVKKRYDLSESCHLLGEENQDLFYRITAYIYDLFGRSSMDQVIVQIDRKAPVSNLYVNNMVYQTQMQISNFPEFKYVIDDMKASMHVEYYLNGKLMNENPEVIFKKMKRNDVLKIMTYTYDILNNLERKEYEFIFVPIEQNEFVVESINTLKEEQVRRIWIKDENNQLVLKKKKRKIIIKKPKIHYVRNNDELRIWVDKNTSIVYVKVNQQHQKIEKDKLNQDFVKVKLKSQNNNIDIKVKSKNGSTKVMHKKEKMYKISIWQRLLRFFKMLFS